MRKSILIIWLMLAVLNSQAQNYLISFAGAGATSVVNTVKVDNLASGATVTLGGGDVLHLVPIVGIGTSDNNNGKMQIFPNPMAEQSILTFVAPETGNAVLSITDLSGKTVCQINTWLLYGANSFRISGINPGMYFVKVNGKNYNFSIKLISQSNLQREAIIECIPAVKNLTGNLLKSSVATVDMPYTAGDRLLFKGISGIYSTIVPDIPVSNKTITFDFHDCTDADNNNYPIVLIGDQTWMAENLKVGVRIDGMQEQIDNETIEKHCYNDSDSFCVIYGGLYEWDEAMQYEATGGVQGICPAGWHLPTNAEWTTLTDNLGGEYFAGGKLKETGTIHWNSPNEGATNESGFTALPGGYRYVDGIFSYFGYDGGWWSSSEAEGIPSSAWGRSIYYSNNEVFTYYRYKVDGYSVRCLRDD